jgi:hypothetical protein
VRIPETTTFFQDKTDERGQWGKIQSRNKRAAPRI